MALGVVLAGGASTRMGTDKALVLVDDRPMVAHVIAALRRACDEIIIAGREGSLGGVACLPDRSDARLGPLAGLVTGLDRATPGGLVAIVAVDQPWVRGETMGHLVQRASDLPVVPVDAGVRQTTCAVYPASVGTAAVAELEAGGSLQSVLDRTAFQPVVEDEWRIWGEDGRSWFSADTPERVEEGMERFGPPGR